MDQNIAGSPSAPNSSSMDQVELTANDLAAEISSQFRLSARVAAVDLNALADMNKSTEMFYAGMNERIGNLSHAAFMVQTRATEAKQFSEDMTVLLLKAKRLEALVDRLSEYISRQEAALSKK